MGDSNGDDGHFRFLDRDVSRLPTHELHRAAWNERELISVGVEQRFAVDARRRDQNEGSTRT